MVSSSNFYYYAPELTSIPNRYPVLIDAVIQSNGIGFVGTDRSTMSEMGRRRSESWHDGCDADG